MTKKMIYGRFLLPALAVLALAACQSDALSRLGVADPSAFFDVAALDGKASKAAPEKMKVNRVEFGPGHKTFSVWTGMLDDIGPYSLTDSTEVRIEVEEYDDGVRNSRRVQPKLVKAWNTESDQIEQLGVKVLVLVDLTLTQDQIDAERSAVEEMSTAFDRNNLYVAFMSGNSVSKTQPISEYILNQYFKKASSSGKRLYRSILEKIREMSDNAEPWSEGIKPRLVVFSDGKVYDDNDKPMDPDHFKMENELLHGKIKGRDSVSVSYVNFGKALDNMEDSAATDVLTSLCQESGGTFQPAFNWTQLENSMLDSFGGVIDANRFDFVNPDGKVYRGDNNQVKLKFYSVKDNKLIATATANTREGTLYKPIIVNGDTLREIIFEGLSVGLLIMLLIYLIGQFLVPYIRYRLFLKKYVVTHTGGNMVIGDVAVGQTCYLCKAPFVRGDQVVVKCEHTMHKSCWDENEYHCPEYGRHCKHGSHYYNKEHLLDRRNASFYMKWLLMAVLASIFAWIAFSVWTNFTTKHILEYVMPAERLNADSFGTHLNQLPSYGFMIGFFLTFGIAFMAIRRKRLVSYLNILGRALIAAIGSAVLYLLASVVCIALHLEAAGFFINLIPWILSSFLIAFVGTWGTRIKLKKSIILVAVALSLISMYLWSSLYMFIGIDFRVLLLFSYMIYAIGMALSIASAAPKSEHYFLHIQGAVKTMDVALYKWFRANPKAVVSIGKSVDCSLQLSWDLQGNVAPVHAEITLKKGILRLTALEDGVTLNGKRLKVDKPKKLYHGSHFQIGQTSFTYQEKDL